MLLQDAPAPFDRVVLAVVGREVKQLDRPAGGVGKVDSTEYLDWSLAGQAKFPNLKPSTQSISLRLPVNLLKSIKIEANR
jgi:hypothetical protein